MSHISAIEISRARQLSPQIVAMWNDKRHPKINVISFITGAVIMTFDEDLLDELMFLQSILINHGRPVDG